jgi:hypothetical protein
VNHQKGFEQLDSRFFEKNPAGFSSASMKVANDSEDSFLGTSNNCESLGKFTCVISESQCTRHINGKEPIKVEIVSTDNMVNFILFDDIKTVKDTRNLWQYLTHMKSGPFEPLITFNPKTETYGAWLFVEPVNAKVAKRIAKTIIGKVEKKFKIKLNCSIYPQYTSFKSSITHGTNEIILPLYAGAKVFVNGKFLDDTDEFTIKIHDFSGLAEYIGE